MATTLLCTLSFGDAVSLTRDADVERAGARVGSVCGFRNSDAGAALQFGVDVGTTLVLVEVPSGEAVEVPCQFLELLT